MGNRKENLKKSLKTTDAEYPSSSDDDYDVPPAIQTMRAYRREPRTSINDMPGTSGINGGQTSTAEMSQTSTRRNQAKADRELYWSLINNTAIPTHTHRPRPTRQEMPAGHRSLSQASKLIKERQILEFKTRSLQNLQQTLSTSNTCQRSGNPTSCYSVPRANRSLPAVSASNTSRSAAQTGYTQPSRLTAASIYASLNRSDHGAHPYSRMSTGHTAVSSSGNMTSTSRVAATSWNTNSTSHAGPRCAWISTSTSHAAPRSSWTAFSTNHPVTSSSWNTTSTNRAAAQEIPGYFPQNREGNLNRTHWRNSIPVNPSAEWLAEYRRVVMRRQPIPDEWIDDETRRDMQRIVKLNLNLNTDQGATMENQHNNQNSFDDMTAESHADSQQPVQPVVPKPEPRDETNENPEEENAEDLPTQNASDTSSGLIEEVVEVAAPDETENLAVPRTEGDQELEGLTSENSTNVAALTESINAAAAESGPSYQGVKRKRDAIDDRREPFSVQDFNMNLLRLLECPVCLEWMEPPISQCRRGHLVCSRCRSRLSACPVCRTSFSSVRNRAMEGVAEMLRYPCRHGCGVEVRLRCRVPHESSCEARKYQCPAPDCKRHPLLQRDELARHFQCKHLPILKIGRKHKFSMKVNAEQHDSWLIMALDEYFHMRVDVDISSWGVSVFVAYIGPKNNASNFYYEVTVEGQHNSRKLVYTRTTHSDLESSSVNVTRQDCFHLTLDQALNFLRIKNRYCEPDKFLDFHVEITKLETTDESREDSD